MRWKFLSRQVPLPAEKGTLEVPVRVAGSTIDLRTYGSQRELLAAIAAELADERLAVEYLAANLERGVYRARYDAAHGSHGVPSPHGTTAASLCPPLSPQAPRTSSYIERAALYRDAARALIGGSSERGR